MSKYGTRSPRVKLEASQADPISKQPSEAVLVPEQLAFPGMVPAELVQASDADSRLIHRLAQAHKRPHRSIVRDKWTSKRKS